MIIDAFIFYNETDLLNIRKEILNGIVDKYVAIESNYTFTNKPKDYLLQSDENLLAIPFKSPLDRDPWKNEIAQRNYIFDALVNNFDLQDDDIIMISDVDEIPNPKAIEYYRDFGFIPCELEENMYYYYMNVQVEEPWAAIKIFRAKDLERDIQGLRFKKLHPITNGGWHFSYLGGLSKIKEKLGAFAHTELNTPEILNSLEDKIQTLQEPFGRNKKLKLVEIDESYPDYIKNNIDELKARGLIL